MRRKEVVATLQHEEREGLRQDLSKSVSDDQARLDTIARFITGDGVVAAVCVYGGKLLVANNLDQNPERVAKMEQFSGDYSEFFTLLNTMGRQRMSPEQIKTDLNVLAKIDTFTSKAWNDILIQRAKNSEEGIPDNDAEWNQETLRSRLLRVAEAFGYGAKEGFSDEVKKALMGGWTNVSNGMHAEMAVLEAIDNNIVGGIEGLQEELYVGTSKLCCHYCSIAITKLNNIFKQSEDVARPLIGRRGTHGTAYPDWKVPEFAQRLFKMKDYNGQVMPEKYGARKKEAPDRSRDASPIRNHGSGKARPGRNVLADVLYVAGQNKGRPGGQNSRSRDNTDGGGFKRQPGRKHEAYILNSAPDNVVSPQGNQDRVAKEMEQTLRKLALVGSEEAQTLLGKLETLDDKIKSLQSQVEIGNQAKYKLGKDLIVKTQEIGGANSKQLIELVRTAGGKVGKTNKATGGENTEADAQKWLSAQILSKEMSKLRKSDEKALVRLAVEENKKNQAVEEARKELKKAVSRLEELVQQVPLVVNGKVAAEEKSHLKRHEKSIIMDSSGQEKYSFAAELHKNAQSQNVTKLREEADKAAKEDMEHLLVQPNAQGRKGSVKLIPETNHSNQHGDNVDELIVQIMSGQLGRNSVICLERKQAGANLGMTDVITLANALKYNKANHETPIALPKGIEKSLIYKDAQLYNAARDNGITVVGIEGKGLKYSKESPLYNATREEHMTGVLKRISDTGKNVVLVIGDAHKENLRSALLDKNIEVKLVERGNEQSMAERAVVKKVEMVRGGSGNIIPIATPRVKKGGQSSGMMKKS